MNKTVAIYLRKSRDEENVGVAVLERHERQLTELANRNGYRIDKIYREIVSGESLSQRHEMQTLLEAVKDNLFDAVLVTEISRLGRGNSLEQAIVLNAFAESNTEIITPTRIYNPSDMDSEMILSFETLLARQELRLIKQRLRAGKSRSANAGNWSNGTPPFGYIYNRETKKLAIVPEEAEVVREIFERCLAGQGLNPIAIELNKRGIKTRTGAYWQDNTVRRAIINRVYTGAVVFEKSQWKGRKKVADIPEEEQIITENAHEAIVSREMFDRAGASLASRKLIPTGARTNKHQLSGLVTCGICGRIHQLQHRPNGTMDVKGCPRIYPDGTKCRNKSIRSDIILNAIYEQLDAYKEQLLNHKSKNSPTKQLERELERKTKALEKINQALQRLADLYEMGDIERREYLDRKNKRNGEINALQKDIRELTKAINAVSSVNNAERLNHLNVLKQTWHELDPRDINRLLHLIISKVSYVRTSKDIVDIEVEYK